MSRRSPQYHVVPSPSGGWGVKRASASRASKVFRTKDEALAYARNLASERRGELVVHYQDGTVQGKSFFGPASPVAQPAS